MNACDEAQPPHNADQVGCCEMLQRLSCRQQSTFHTSHMLPLLFWLPADACFAGGGLSRLRHVANANSTPDGGRASRSNTLGTPASEDSSLRDGAHALRMLGGRLVEC